MHRQLKNLRHVMSPLDLSVEELNHIMELAADMEKNP